jgi:hypothetical protein
MGVENSPLCFALIATVTAGRVGVGKIGEVEVDDALLSVAASIRANPAPAEKLA